MGSTQDTLSDELIRHLDSFIRDHLSTVDRTQLSQEAHYGVTRFSELFKNTTSLSPHQYILQKRLDVAHCLITSSDRTLAEIALMTGFSDQSHLSNKYKERFGHSPKEALAADKAGKME